MEQNNYQEPIEYLLKVLNYNDYKQFPEDSGEKPPFIDVYPNGVKTGQLKPYVYKYLAYDYEAKDKKPISVAIVPKWIETILVNTKESSEDSHESFIPIAPMYINTKITPDGILDLATAKPVWATCLELPNDIDGVSLLKHEIKGHPDNTSWQNFMESVQQLYESRYGISWESEKIKDSTNRSHPIRSKNDSGKTCYWVMREDAVTGTTRHIVNLLKRLNDYPNEMNMLFKTMLGDTVASENGVPQLGVNVSDHRGQMKNEYPLADAQRHAIHCMSRLTNGNVLAVSGPPGTGKTTMLQSVVASLIIEHALKTDPKPPVILATSANNKAITNVIDAFRIEDEDKVASPLFTRWIRFNDSPLPLAVYLPSEMAKEKDKFFCSSEIGGGDYQLLRDSWNDCKNYFIGMARKSGLSVSNDIPTMKRTIHGQLQEACGMLKKFEKSLDNPRKERSSSFLSKLITFLKDGGQPKMSEAEMEAYLTREVLESSAEFKLINQNIDKESDPEKRRSLEIKKDKFINGLKYKEGTPFMDYADRMLDRCLRFKCFWLAVHYFEACWLEKVQENPQLRLSRQCRKDIYSEMAYVSPCIVATFFRAPKCFRKSYDANEGLGYLFDYIDLLIVDEAGQACTEIGLPTFALAKKAIVVGDEDQIPPIYSIKTGTSRSYWGKGTDSRTFKLIDSSSSSVMRVASKQSAFRRIWSDGDILEGLFLDEHRRCNDDIIAYCNKLIYKGRLKPLAGNTKDGESVLPVMGHLCVPHANSETPPTGSRRSREEAQAIAQWIKKNENIIRKENKGKEPKECISVITPFTLQAKLIREELSKVGYVYDNDNKENDKGIPVGTVHTFQGAESPIVIYSTVYGFEEKFSFVDGNRELMNVAVSRAKKHFFLFSSKEPEQAEKSDSPYNLLLRMTSTVVRDDYSSSLTDPR